MTAVIDYLPVWKKDSTAEEWFGELQAIARKYPERFKRVALVAEEETDGLRRYKFFSRGCSNLECAGMHAIGIREFTE